MAKTDVRHPEPRAAGGKGGEGSEGGESPKPPAESIKETIDSIVIALSLALVFRAFVVEAFVIPTGSMADTLLGMHRTFVCRSCGYQFQVGINSASADAAPQLQPPPSDKQMTDKEIYCPNCEARIDKNDRQTMGVHNPDQGGDKILVFKFPYLFAEPQRWDVIVFYNPARPEENFIKRLIGTPGECIQIRDGDIYAGPDADHLVIQRKPPRVQQALWRPVYLNDYLPKQHSRAAGTAPTWQPAASTSFWQSDGRTLAYKPEPGKDVASDSHRLKFVSGQLGLGLHDYYAYNQYRKIPSLENVVRDLKLECVAFFKDPGAAVSLSMNRRENRFEATFHQGGLIELRRYVNGVIQDEVRKHTAGPFPLDRGVQVALQNVDFVASAWVAGRQVLDWVHEPPASAIDPAKELPEVRIEAHQKPLELWHVGLYRDVYYTSRIEAQQGAAADVERGSPNAHEPVVELRGSAGRDDPNDEFFVLGDNSPSSSDGRVWRISETGSWHLRGRIEHNKYRAGRVPRDHLIGQAFFVYWPAGLRLFGSSWQLVPNVGRMRLIH